MCQSVRRQPVQYSNTRQDHHHNKQQNNNTKQNLHHTNTTQNEMGHKTKFITKLTNINIAYETNNTTGNMLTHNTQTNTKSTGDKFNKIGIYQLTCKDSIKKYISQTGEFFYTRFHKHINDFKHGKGSYKFAQHLIENRHSIGPIDDIMEVQHTLKKGRMMDRLEKFLIYKETKSENQINNNNTKHSF
jgi:hypothetical protein